MVPQMSNMSFFQRLSLFLYLAVFFQSFQAFAKPISDRSFSPYPGRPYSGLSADALRLPNQERDLTPNIVKRGPVTHYRGMSPWRMVLTASSMFSSSIQNIGVQTASSSMAKFFAGIYTEVSQNIDLKTAESAFTEFGSGRLLLALRVRDAIGAPVTIPWTLVQALAKDFEMRARNGNPTAFRAVITGPFAKNAMGGMPWIEVVLTVAGNKILDEIPWSIY